MVQEGVSIAVDLALAGSGRLAAFELLRGEVGSGPWGPDLFEASWAVGVAPAACHRGDAELGQ